MALLHSPGLPPVSARGQPRLPRAARSAAPGPPPPAAWPCVDFHPCDREPHRSTGPPSHQAAELRKGVSLPPPQPGRVRAHWPSRFLSRFLGPSRRSYALALAITFLERSEARSAVPNLSRAAPRLDYLAAKIASSNARKHTRRCLQRLWAVIDITLRPHLVDVRLPQRCQMATQNRPKWDVSILHVAPFRTVRPVSFLLYGVRLEVRILPPQSFFAAVSLGLAGTLYPSAPDSRCTKPPLTPSRKGGTVRPSQRPDPLAY